MKEFITLLVILFVPFSYAKNDLDYLSFTFENDAFFKDDGLYSNGLLGSWGYNDLSRLDKQTLPTWLAYLAQASYLSSLKEKHYAISYSIGQLLQTAIDLSQEELVEEDAPYVGLLAWKGQLSAYDDLQNDQLSLILGLVGPASGAEFVQNFVHEITGSTTPQGWGNQINNEFVLRLQAQRLWRIYDMQLKTTDFDMIGGVHGGLGNYRSDIAAGLGVRWGQDLAKNFLSASAFPVQKFNQPQNSPHGWYFFANVSAFYVANDIFIDGNTFQDSHSVDLIHQQFSMSAGFMVNIYSWNIFYTLLHSTDQYHGQNERTRFGSVTVTYNF